MSIPGSASPLLLASTAAAGGNYQIERSLRFNPADTPYLQRVFSGNGSNMKIRTFSCWVKRSGLGANKEIFSNYGGAGHTRLTFDGDTLYAEVAGALLQTTQVFRDVSAWYHILFAWDTTQATSSNRSKLYVNGTQITTFSTANYPTQNADTNFATTTGNSIIGQYQNIGGYVLDGYLAEVFFIDGQALTPSSFTEVSATTGQLIPLAYSGSFGTNGFWLKFSDNSAATAATLGKDYSGNNNDWTPNNLTATTNPVYSNSVTEVGGQVFYGGGSAKKVFDGDIINGNDNYGTTGNTPSNTNCIRATFTTPSTNVTSLRVYGAGNSSFTCKVWYNNDESTKIDILDPVGWKTFTLGSPITLSSLSWGNNASSNGGMNVRAIEVNGTILVDGVPSNIDSLVDTPTSFGTDTYVGGEVRGNYATFNPLALGSYASLTNGNLDITGNTSANAGGSLSTVGFTSGKYYYEYVANSTGAVYGGVVTFYSNDTSTLIDEGNVFGRISANKGIGIRGLGNIQGNAAEQQSIAAFTYSAGEVIGVAIDADYGAVYFSKSGSFLNSGVPTSGASRTGSFHNWTPSSSRICYPAVSAYQTNASASANFGQRAFAYTAPSGFKALCDTNLGAPLVAKPNTVFDIALYTGNSSTQAVSGLAFSPDLVWLKGRSVAGYWNFFFDTIRGTNKYIASNRTDAEATFVSGLNSFDSNGFTLGSQADVNYLNDTFVGWAWDAGTSTVSNTAGSITSQVRANASAGFSVVSYTSNATAGATVGHSLGVAPEFVIARLRNQTASWSVYHKSLGASKYILLSSTNAEVSSTQEWGGTTPTSTVVTIGNASANNNAISGSTAIMYCFAPVVGYSSFGSYTGNGSADGPFIYTGFRPRWILLKASSASGAWILHDTARTTYNVMGNELRPDDSTAEYAVDRFDLLSNGFKVRSSNATLNTSSATYIYAAFAENPFQYARAR